MPIYSYQAMDGRGVAIKGEIEAKSSDDAANAVAERGYIPFKLTEKKVQGSKPGRLLGFKPKVKLADMIIFTKQFRSLFKAGVPLVRSFQILEAQTQSRALKEAISSILQNVKEGAALSVAMSNHGSIFPPLYCSMIEAGEMSGTVPETLERLIYIIEHEGKIKSDIKAALQYPIMVTIALTIAFFVLLTVVIPKFAETFARSGLDLPLPTVIAINLYKFLSSYWHLLIGGLLALIFGLRAWFKTENGQYIRDSLILRIPVLGELFVKAAMSRFA
ncbi:MAG: type II secretion system F family protein, partial [Desulfobacterales bacterium]|nr:type II secretion system F family protein [Desulfobacterales bacterium]